METVKFVVAKVDIVDNLIEWCQPLNVLFCIVLPKLFPAGIHALCKQKKENIHRTDEYLFGPMDSAYISLYVSALMCAFGNRVERYLDAVCSCGSRAVPRRRQRRRFETARHEQSFGTNACIRSNEAVPDYTL